MAKITYDKDTDYQALINQAIQSGNVSLARQYEAQRNAKIADMNAQGTNIEGYQQTYYYQPLDLPEYKPYSGTTPTLNMPKYKPYSGTIPTLNMPEYKPFSYKDFNYNAENDDIYKQYVEQFARQGQSAGERSLAGAAALTGGMPSSFAAAANAQAQQAYAKKTADMIPVLEQNAYNRYLGERNFSYQDYLNQYNAEVDRAKSMYDADWRSTNFSYQDYLNQYNADVDRAKSMYDADWRSTNFNYQDYLNKYNADVDRARAAYDSEIGQRDFNYQNYLNKLDNDYRQSEFDWRKDIDVRDFNYMTKQDAIRNSISWANHRLSKEKFEYDKQQDALAREDSKWDRYFDAVEDNYPNTVMGQLEAREAEAQEIERQNNIRAIVSSALQAPNASEWLKENAAYLSDDEYATVIKILKDYGTISKQGE